MPAVSDEGARAKRIVDDLDASAKGAPADVSASVSRARQALARAHGAHAAGDARTARLLGTVALGWADAAKAQLSATQSERSSADVEQAAVDLAARRDRGRALITEAQARRGQLTAQIERKKREIEAAKTPPAKPTSKKADGAKRPAEAPDAPKAPKAPDAPKKPTTKKKGGQP